MKVRYNPEGLPICPHCYRTMYYVGCGSRDTETMGGSHIEYAECSVCGDFSIIDGEVYPLNGE